MQLRSPARAPTINLTWSLATAVAAHADVASSSKPHAHMTYHSLPGGYVGAGLMSWLFHFIPCPLTPPPSRPGRQAVVRRPSAQRARKRRTISPLQREREVIEDSRVEMRRGDSAISAEANFVPWSTLDLRDTMAPGGRPHAISEAAGLHHGRDCRG